MKPDIVHVDATAIIVTPRNWNDVLITTKGTCNYPCLIWILMCFYTCRVTTLAVYNIKQDTSNWISAGVWGAVEEKCLAFCHTCTIIFMTGIHCFLFFFTPSWRDVLCVLWRFLPVVFYMADSSYWLWWLLHGHAFGLHVGFPVGFKHTHKRYFIFRTKWKDEYHTKLDTIIVWLSFLC